MTEPAAKEKTLVSSMTSASASATTPLSFIDNEKCITKEFNLETKIRQCISEIVEPALKKTEECVKLVDFFSGVIDTSTKKFDECFDIYEVLREKCRLRFKELDGLTLQVSQINNEQIINTGMMKQEVKELRQEIVELKESIIVKSDQIQQLNLANEKLSNELLDLSNRIQDTRCDYQDKIADLVKTHFANFLKTQVEFAQIKEQFTLSTKSLESHNSIFDTLQSSVDLYKVERQEMNQKLEEIYNMLAERVPLIDFQFFSERIERSLINDVRQEKLDRTNMCRDISKLLDTHIESIDNLKKSTTKSLSELDSSLNKLQHFTNHQKSSISILQSDCTHLRSEQEAHSSQLTDHTTILDSQTHIVNDLKQTLRKEFLKFEQNLSESKQTTIQQINDALSKNNLKFKQELSSELNISLTRPRNNSSQINLRKQSATNNYAANGESSPSNGLNPNDGENSQLGDNSENAINHELHLNTFDENLPMNLSDPAFVNQLEDIVLRMIDLNALGVTSPTKRSAAATAAAAGRKQSNNFSTDNVAAIAREEAQRLLDEFEIAQNEKFKSEIQNTMLSNSDIHDIKQDLVKIDSLKIKMEDTFENMKEINADQSDKIERMSFKMTTIQSDITIQNDYVINQLKRVIKDKDAMQKTLTSLSLLTTILSETSLISSAAFLTKELAHSRKLKQTGNPNNSTIDHNDTRSGAIIPAAGIRIQSLQDGLIFDASDQIRMNGNRLSYRSQVVDRTEIISNAMAALISVWDGMPAFAFENSPSKVFKNSILLKQQSPQQQQQQPQQQLPLNQKQIRVHSSSKQTRPRNREEEPNSSKLSIREHSTNSVTKQTHMPIIPQNTSGFIPYATSTQISNPALLASSTHHNTTINVLNTQQTQGNLNHSMVSNASNLTAQQSMRQSQDCFSPEHKQNSSHSKKGSMSVNHRKLLHSLKDFNQNHLVNIQKQLATPSTIEKQKKNKVPSSMATSASLGNNTEMHKFNLTFIPSTIPKSP